MSGLHYKPSSFLLKIIVTSILLCYTSSTSKEFFGYPSPSDGGDQKVQTTPGELHSTVTTATGVCWNACRCLTIPNGTIVNCSRSGIELLPLPLSTHDVSDLSTSIRTLAADWNRLSTLVANLSSSMPNVESLSFEHNNISDISPDAFKGLRFLRSLNLNDNAVRQFPEQLFADVARLADLSVGGNPLDVFSIGVALSRLPAGRLRRLDISRTAVGQTGPLPEELFGKLQGLDQLRMHDVTIENMTADYFSALRYDLLTLDLTNANIDSVDEKSFEKLATSLSELILDSVFISTADLENIFLGFDQKAGVSMTTPSFRAENISSRSSSNSSNSSSVDDMTTLAPINGQLETLSLRNVFADESDDKKINGHMFRHLSKTRLKTLRFDGNYFGHHLGGKIPERLFHPLRHLVSLSLNYCDIRSISSETFRGLHHLQTLSLRGNQLSCVRQSNCGFMTASNAKLNRLTVLDLSDNLLESGAVDNTDDITTGNTIGIRFPDDVFPELVELYLNGNRLSSISVGTFGNLRRLERLELSDNTRLSDIEPESFAGLSGLVRLKLDGCRRLTHLKAGTLTGLTNLRVLSMKDSGLVHIHHSALAHLEHLEDLNLRNNRLGEQDDKYERRTIRSPNNLKSIDLGDNRLRTVPTGLLQHSAKLRAINLDGNRLTDCSGLQILKSRPLNVASHELVINLSNNLIIEPSDDCFSGRTSKIYLGGNPLYCGSCATAQFIAFASSDSFKTRLLDRGSVTCVSPSESAGLSAFNDVAALPGNWQCRWRDVITAVALAALSLTVVLVIIAVVRRRLMLTSCCNRVGRRRYLGRTVSTATGSSSVTISNGCYGNGSMSDSSTPQPTTSGLGGCSGSELTSAKYSPLVEDDARHDVEAPISNGHHKWLATNAQSNRLSVNSSSDQCAIGDDLDGMTSSTVDLKCPLIGNGASGRHDQSAADNKREVDHETQRAKSNMTTGSTGGRSSRSNRTDRTLVDGTSTADDDVEDSL